MATHSAESAAIADRVIRLRDGVLDEAHVASVGAPLSLLLLFWRLIVRPLRREPLRSALTVLSVALGVAVVVAIDLAGSAAAGSFHSSLESLTGKADLELTATGGLDESLLARLVQLPLPLTFTPRIEDWASINGKGEALPFIGLDLIANSSFEGPDAALEDAQDAADATYRGQSNLGWPASGFKKRRSRPAAHQRPATRLHGARRAQTQ